MNLQLNNINFKYKNTNTTIFSNLNISIENKSITAIMGASGSGKSTLLRLITGLETPQSGEIILDNNILNNSKINIPTEKRNIGMVFQNYVLFPNKTVLENIKFGLDNIKSLTSAQKSERCDNILELIEMNEFRKSYPHQLSGGQQQRVALARALAVQPKLLLLDEPFSNLDTFLKNKIQSELKSIIQKADITTIMVTHSVSELHMADNVILLSKDLIKCGTLEELRSDINCPLIKNLLLN